MFPPALPSRFALTTAGLLLAGTAPLMAATVDDGEVISDTRTERQETGAADGRLTITPTGRIQTDDATALVVQHDGWTVVNRGTIFDSGQSAVAIGLNFGLGSFTNHGTITTGGSAAAVAVGANNTAYAVTNHGTIQGGSGAAVLLADATVVNHGLIVGTTGITDPGAVAAQQIVINDGIILGTAAAGVSLGGLDDVLINAGTITGASTDAVDMGSGNDQVTLQTGSAITGGILGGTGNDILWLEGSGSLGNVVTGFEILGKLNFGTWVLDADYTFSTGVAANGGVIVVAAGTTLSTPILWLDGGLVDLQGDINLLGGMLTVNPGSALGGIGTILGDVVNNGVILPGNSIGTLTIDGDYTHNGRLTIEVSAAGTSDLLQVTGTATINSGDVLFVPEDLGFYREGMTYTVLTAAGGVTGTFDAVHGYISPVLYWDTVSNPTSIDAVIRRLPYQAGASSGNRQATASALDLLRPFAWGDMAAVLLHLDNQHNPQQYGQALDRLGPAWSDGLTRGAIAGADRHQDGVDDRRSRQRRNRGLQEQADLSQFAQALDLEAGNDRSWLGWGEVFGGIGSEDETPNQEGYRFQMQGTSVGCDRRIGPITGGGSLAVTQVITGGSAAGGSGMVTSYRGNGYGGIVLGDITIEGAGGMGWSDYAGQRAINFGLVSRQADSSHGGQDFYGQLGAAWDRWLGVWNLGVDGAYRYGRIDENGYAETGALSLDLEVDDRGAVRSHTRLGVRLARATTWQGLLLLPEITLRWSHVLDTDPRSIDAHFAEYPWFTFTVTGREPPGDLLRCGFTVDAVCWGLATFTVSYRADLEAGRGLASQAFGASVHLGF